MINLFKILAVITILLTTQKNSLALGVINMVEFGADNSGKTDCSDLVRKAQQLGDVYFPKGTYLMSAVDVISNRKYYGDGREKTVIKSLFKNAKTTFGISIINYDKSGHINRNVENVQISDLTIDFNFYNKWIDFFCPIQFKGAKGYYIKNIVINNVGFIDNARLPHPDLTGGNGKDAWCINLSAFCDSTSDILIQRCISKAESHQFIAGGGNILQRVKVLDNFILRPNANGIAFTTVSAQNCSFKDFEVFGNTIMDAGGSSILFGLDPGKSKAIGSVQTFENLHVAKNKIYYSNYNVYGTSHRKKKSHPYVINLNGSEPYMKNIVVENNEIIVQDNYTGGDICLGKIRSTTIKRPASTVAQAFKQPAINSSTDITISADLQQDNKAGYYSGGYARIGSYIYDITKVDHNKISLTLSLSFANGGNTAKSMIPAGSSIYFISGKLENIQFLNNKITGRYLRIIPGGFINKLLVNGNNMVFLTMPYPDCAVGNAELKNNINFSFSQRDGFINGVMSNNKITGKAVDTKKLTGALTSGKIQNNLKIFDNY